MAVGPGGSTKDHFPPILAVRNVLSELRIFKEKHKNIAEKQKVEMTAQSDYRAVLVVKKRNVTKKLKYSLHCGKSYFRLKCGQ